MKTSQKILSVGMIVLLLGTLAVPATAASAQDSELHVTRMVVEPAGPDLHFTVYYESSLFTRVFSLIFGAKVLQPDILKVFANFTNVSLVSIDANNNVAKVDIKNISVPGQDGWYAYDNDTTFTSKIGVIEVHNADGKVVTVTNTNRLPAISNRMPAINKK